MIALHTIRAYVSQLIQCYTENKSYIPIFGDQGIIVFLRVATSVVIDHGYMGVQ